MNKAKRSYLKSLVKERKLTPAERLSNRLGYMGAAFIMISPYLLPYGNIGGVTYIIGGCLAIPQVWMAKQWNLVSSWLHYIFDEFKWGYLTKE